MSHHKPKIGKNHSIFIDDIASFSTDHFDVLKIARNAFHRVCSPVDGVGVGGGARPSDAEAAAFFSDHPVRGAPAK